MIPHKHDKLNDIKNKFYNQFKDFDWFKGAGLYRKDKTEFCILALVKKENVKDIPEIFQGIEVKTTIVI